MSFDLWDSLEIQFLIKRMKIARYLVLATEQSGFQPLITHGPDVKQEERHRAARGGCHEYLIDKTSSAGKSKLKGMSGYSAPNEYLASKVGKAINAPVGEVKINKHDSSNPKNTSEIEMPHINGVDADSAYLDQIHNNNQDHPLHPKNHHKLPGAKQLGLLDHLIGNQDRSLQHNYMIPKDDNGDFKQEVRGIDHELAFSPRNPSLRQTPSPFSQYWIPKNSEYYDDWDDKREPEFRRPIHGFSADELNKLKPELQKLRPEFDQFDMPGEEHPGSLSYGKRHDLMMTRLDHLIKTAKPIDERTGFPEGFDTNREVVDDYDDWV